MILCLNPDNPQPLTLTLHYHPRMAIVNIELYFCILGSKTDAWSGKRNTKWHQWTSFHITCHHTDTPTLNSIFTRHSLLICPHRTRGIVFRILARDSTSFINLNNIKDIRTIRKVPRMRCLAAIVAILKSILKSSDLKTTPIAAMMLWKQLMSWVELNCVRRQFSSMDVLSVLI